MNTRKFFAAAVLAVTAAGCAPAPAPSVATISGNVTVSICTELVCFVPVPRDGTVELVNSASPANSTSVATGANAAYSANVAPGTYEVSVAGAPASECPHTTLTVAAGDTPTVDIFCIVNSRG